MDYSYKKSFSLPFDEVIEKTIESLQVHGFGVLTDIDVQKTFKKKLDVDFKKYRILGACNPPRALHALESEEEIGLFLPCNVIIYEKNDEVIVSMIRPVRAFSLIENEELTELAQEVEDILMKVINEI